MTFIPLKTYPIAVTGTATAGLSIAEFYPQGLLAGREGQAQLYAKSCDMIYNFSDLSTATASVTLTDHVTNGTFASDTAWTKGTGWSIGAGVGTATGAISTALSQIVNPIVGRTYTLVYTITQSAGSITPVVGGTSGTARSSSATFTENIVCGSTDGLLSFTTSGFTGTIDNVTLKSTGYPDGNNLVPSGSFVVNSGVAKYISVMSQDASSTGTLFLTTGYNDKT